MFARSAAPDTLQGKAICHVNRHWGDDALQRAGRESLAVPVCKKKYAPFVFPIVKKKTGTTAPDGTTDRTTYEVQVVRMYGCRCHHEHRKKVIERYGERKGWEPFGQWSMKKAVELARRESQRLNSEEQSTTTTPARARASPPPPSALLTTTRRTKSSPSSVASSSTSSDYDDGSSDDGEDDSDSDSEVSVRGAGVARNMCLSGKCLWKVKTAYDDVFMELTGQTESEAEDNSSATP